MSNVGSSIAIKEMEFVITVFLREISLPFPMSLHLKGVSVENLTKLLKNKHPFHTVSSQDMKRSESFPIHSVRMILLLY